ncbi:hypothetical protein [Luteimonas abyssi]|uniref:hypothetical protein n=1 Tax=Luteimonas abyssi TaxID=1247514 RepID=UPI000737C47E|nr:hypothetical protein [Luteimonas abyssi]
MRASRSFWEWGLIVVGLIVVVTTLSPSIGGDGSVRFQTVDAWLRGEAAYSKFSLVMPLLSMPLAWAAVVAGVNPAEWVAYFNFAAFVVLSGLAYVEIARRYSPAVGRAWLLLMLGASMFPHHLQHYYGEVLSGMCFFVGILWMDRCRWLSVLLLAAACAATPALLVPFAGLAAVWFLVDRKVVPLVATVAAVAVALLEMWLKGSGVGGGYLSAGERGFQTILPYSGLPGFSYPMVFGLLSILLSFGKGLVFYIPALLLAASARSRAALGLDSRLRWIALAAFVGPVLIYSKWWAWYGGSFWGPRFFLFMCAPACLLMASALQERGVSIARLAAVVSIVVLSVWVAVSGYVFAQSNMDMCWVDNYASEFLCWYVPEFSALWRPFVTGSVWQLFDEARWPYAVWSVAAIACLLVPFVRARLELPEDHTAQSASERVGPPIGARIDAPAGVAMPWWRSPGVPAAVSATDGAGLADVVRFRPERMIATVVVFLVSLALLHYRATPTVAPDEAGVYAIAQYLVGRPFIDMSAAPFYSPLAAIFYAPALALFDDPYLVYRAIIVINCALVASCVPLLLGIADAIGLRQRNRLVVWGAVLVALWPSYTYPAAMGWAESAFRPVFLLAMLAALRLAAQAGWGWLLTFCAAVVLAFLAHARGLPLVPLAVVYLLVLWWWGAQSAQKSLAGLALLVAFFILATMLNRHLVEAVWGGSTSRGMGYLIDQFTGALSDGDKTVNAFNVLVGQAWYQIVSTLGIFAIGCYWIGKRVLLQRDVGLLFVALSVAAVAAASVAQMLGASRVDHLVYGRYLDGASIVVFWCGLVALLGRTLSWKETAVTFFAALLFSCVALLVFIQSAPVSELAAAHPNNVAGIAAYFDHPNTVWMVVGRPTIGLFVAAIMLLCVRSGIGRAAVISLALVAQMAFLFPKVAKQSRAVERNMERDVGVLQQFPNLHWTDADRQSLWLYSVQMMMDAPFKTIGNSAPVPGPDGALITNHPRDGAACETPVRSKMRVYHDACNDASGH